MNEDKLRKHLEDYRSGKISLEQIIEIYRHLPFEDIGFAKIDHHRNLRRGFPEVIYGEGKDVDQLFEIASRLQKSEQPVLITRVKSTQYQQIQSLLPELTYNSTAKCAFWMPEFQDLGTGYILIVAAGTSDLAVAEEAVITCTVMGNRVEKLYDVGVAGIHRLIRYIEIMNSAEVIITVAGMDGALPSVVGGLTRRPVIAVPTSVGYGANFHGIAPLLTMLNSCASGVTVVNIDNGFGAGFAASLINRKKS